MNTNGQKKLSWAILALALFVFASSASANENYTNANTAIVSTTLFQGLGGPSMTLPNEPLPVFIHTLYPYAYCASDGIRFERTVSLPKDVAWIEVFGEMANNGKSTVRVLMVVGDEGEIPMDFRAHIILNGWIEPGEVVDVDELLAKNWYNRLADSLMDAYRSDDVTAHLYLLSQSPVDIESTGIEITSEFLF